ncbi:MAG: type II secretion system F family protein [Actinobacteria bacterium]|nr:type II secretion system F family protein [Actinomycetota bacterium]
MSTFVYKVRDFRGAPAKGEVEADSRSAAAASLLGQGLTVVELSEKKKSGISLGEAFADLHRLKAKDITVFSRQFATMINSGLPLLRALHILEGQTANKQMKAVVADIRTKVEGGSSLSDAMEKHANIFNRLYISMVRAGEAGGILDQTLLRVSAQLESEDSLKRSIKSAMVYPILIACFAVLIMAGMLIFIIPVFAGMYKQLGGQLPLLTRIMVTISSNLTSVYGVITGAVIIGGIYGLVRYKRSPAGTAVWDRLKLRMPMGIGEIVRKLAMARFSRTLGTLVSSGVPILQAIEITGDTAGNVVVAAAMADVKKEIKEGKPMSDPLSRSEVFPPMVTQMIAVGEETGAIDTMLGKIADFYEDEVNASIKSLTSILEPIMMMGVGALVGVIVISLYLPIFNLMNIVH